MSRYRQIKGPARGVARFALALVLGAACAGALAEDAGTRYAKLLADTESLAKYNTTIENQLQTQLTELTEIQAHTAGMDATGAEFGALVTRMFEKLDQFIAADLPFLDPVSDRKARMERLREMMAAEGTSMAEKYRRLLEAYQIELEYGRTVASYTAPLPDGREAEYVRIGRISLLYRTADGLEAGYWDASEKKWVADNRYDNAVLYALRIAKKEVAPDVIEVPVPAAQEVGS